MSGMQVAQPSFPRMRAETEAEYSSWMSAVPSAISSDVLWRASAYRLALFALRLATRDAHPLARDARTRHVAPQLVRAVGSIAANVAEGYGRVSRADRARMFEYALGSARESLVWYLAGADILGATFVEARLELLVQIRRLLIRMIVNQRPHRGA